MTENLAGRGEGLAGPAATQEQPAGSAPHFVPLTPEQIKANEKETVALGSPRKVGEDGDIELAQEILKPHWPSVRNIEENEARQKEVERIAKILQRREEVRTRTPDWQERPSSVPVGEQKQEEGV